MLSLRDRIRQGVFIMDGAMGTQIQQRGVPEAAWGHSKGCHEVLNLTAPDLIQAIHRDYFMAGCDAVETNTFGATPLSLAEYGLAEKAVEINRAAARNARAAAQTSEGLPRYVLGSIGPGRRLPTLGAITFDALCDSYKAQIEGLLEGGVDGLIVETCQDLLQIKAALAAVFALTGRSSAPLIYVSVSMETNGAMLTGSGMDAVRAVLAPYPIDVLGLNCGTGPEGMRPHLEFLARYWDRYTACMPNAGMPNMQQGQTLYPLTPADFANHVETLVRTLHLNIAGGCCGTTPAHIEALAKALKGFAPAPRNIQAPQQVGSLYAPIDLSQTPPPLLIGERANASGSKAFREALRSGSIDDAFDLMQAQETDGAHVLDVSTAYAGGQEMENMFALVERAAQQCRRPLMIDSKRPEVVEGALQRYGGRAIVNSVSLEHGEEAAIRIMDLSAQYGAALVALTIDEQGMAFTATRKEEVARRLVQLAGAHGLQPGDLLIDPLTFAVACNDEKTGATARETLAAIPRIKQACPGVRVMLGLSNVSFGMSPAARGVVNAVFLELALAAGMDACIIHVAAMTKANRYPAAVTDAVRRLLLSDDSQGDPLTNFIEALAEHDIA
jgi:5-methyltetrahydrofolate--homocysteine methyltransferase